MYRSFDLSNRAHLLTAVHGSHCNLFHRSHDNSQWKAVCRNIPLEQWSCPAGARPGGYYNDGRTAASLRFAFTKNDGTIVVWGSDAGNYNAAGAPANIPPGSGYRLMAGTHSSFTAIKVADGSLTTW